MNTVLKLKYFLNPIQAAREASEKSDEVKYLTAFFLASINITVCYIFLVNLPSKSAPSIDISSAGFSSFYSVHLLKMISFGLALFGVFRIFRAPVKCSTIFYIFAWAGIYPEMVSLTIVTLLIAIGYHVRGLMFAPIFTLAAIIGVFVCLYVLIRSLQEATGVHWVNCIARLFLAFLFYGVVFSLLNFILGSSPFSWVLMPFLFV